jgi:hypothetical protein
MGAVPQASPAPKPLSHHQIVWLDAAFLKGFVDARWLWVRT